MLIRHWITFFVACSVHATSTGVCTPPASASVRTGATPVCGPRIVGASTVLKPGSMVLIGELHGTIEIEHSVGDLVCQAATGGTEVWVGLEIPEDEQTRVDTFLFSNGSSKDRQELLVGNFWKGDDGRSSRAMLDLLDQVRVLNHAGLRIRVIAFVERSVASSKAHEAAMANNIISGRERFSHDMFVILVGNVHARTIEEAFPGARFPPMAWYLRQRFSDVISLNVTYATGTAWNCQSSLAGQNMCEIHSAEGVDRGAKAFIELFKSPDARGYSGNLYVGAVTASPPAVTTDE